jgi:hypothetical protein
MEMRRTFKIAPKTSATGNSWKKFESIIVSTRREESTTILNTQTDEGRRLNNRQYLDKKTESSSMDLTGMYLTGIYDTENHWKKRMISIMESQEKDDWNDEQTRWRQNKIRSQRDDDDLQPTREGEETKRTKIPRRNNKEAHDEKKSR